ncbi:Glucose-6-phosphate isomerase 1, chloroplastic [Dichanthelium oligosanthes]|uniref:Glucose-6-phosphate isomerase n=1 Tax=Dichanthelium oligosanthes TaxID=888268 RepID=A0A1E5VD28_9POAL|nr:Glucose-6-phosphate isomerase 1, chloroplastic [Dichanthelium oligosanthes]
MASISGAAAPPSSAACRLRLRRHLLLRPSHLRLRAPHSIADLSRSSSSSNSAPTPAQPLGSRAENGRGGSRAVEKDPIRLWERYVEWLYQHKELGLFVDVSRMGFTEEFLQQMEPMMQRAFAAMRELEKGAIANPDEGRMVGHYWLRDPALAPNSFLRNKIETTLDSILAFSQDVVSGKIQSPSGRFTSILSIGIGGSALGPQFVAEALAPDNPPLKIRFIDNTDPAGIDHQIAQLGPELATTLVIVISKSGGTPETRNGLLEVQKAFRDVGLEFSKQGVAITQENSLLDNTARIEGWLARFPMFDWVGGRTSEMSAVGLLPAALQGIDIKEMLVGAALMDEETRNTVVKENPAALLALCWYWASEGIGNKDMVVLPYKDSLLLLSRYLQQLVMESLGKEFDLDGNRVNQGLTVYGNKGSTDQHAYIQQLREGVHNFFVTFIEVLRDRPPGHDWELEPGVTCGDYLFGMLQGTRSALYANDRESISVTVQEVTPRTVGALIALYERAVGIYASLVNINAYHQPGVEAGKKAAGEVLALQKRVLTVLNEATYGISDLCSGYCFFMNCKDPAEPLTLDEIADRCHCPEDIEMIYKIIQHMAANDRALIAEGSCGSPRSVKVYLGECNVDEDMQAA